jgi:hypothetical protein
MYEVAPGVGRLALVRWRGAVAMDELVPFLGEVRAMVAAGPPHQVVCSDFRRCDGFPTAALDAIVWSVMRQDNPRIECSAFLVEEGNRRIREQFETMIAQGGHTGRRVFVATAPMLAWVSPRLNPAEAMHLTTFLERERSDRPPRARTGQ